jgi:hypothetical protein
MRIIAYYDATYPDHGSDPDASTIAGLAQAFISDCGEARAEYNQAAISRALHDANAWYSNNEDFERVRNLVHEAEEDFPPEVRVCLDTSSALIEEFNAGVSSFSWACLHREEARRFLLRWNLGGRDDSW